MVELGDPITPVDPNTTGLTQHFLWDSCCIHWVSISSSHIEAFLYQKLLPLHLSSKMVRPVLRLLIGIIGTKGLQRKQAHLWKWKRLRSLKMSRQRIRNYSSMGANWRGSLRTIYLEFLCLHSMLPYFFFCFINITFLLHQIFPCYYEAFFTSIFSLQQTNCSW
jgi:hypothetical protein